MGRDGKEGEAKRKGGHDQLCNVYTYGNVAVKPTCLYH
jgi:hypothetical protein